MQNRYIHDLLNHPCVQQIMDSIHNNNGSAKLVGGCVRDSFTHSSPSFIHSCDIDIATNLSPEDLIKAFKKNGLKVIPTGLKHGTVTVVSMKRNIEVTTLRKDVKCDGRHAIVEFSSQWKEDAARRDFTFNALYANTNGEIDDYFNGLQDLSLRQIKFVGNPIERIHEDYLRILRAFRFHSQICTQPMDEEILEAIRKTAPNLANISRERIQAEMFKLLSHRNPSKTIEFMNQTSVSDFVFGTYLQCPEITTNIFIPSIVKLAFILRHNNKRHLSSQISIMWKMSKKDSKLLDICTNSEFDVKKIKKDVYFFGKDVYKLILKMYLIEGLIKEEELMSFFDFIDGMNDYQLPISGQDILDLGYYGKDIGLVLNAVKEYYSSLDYNATKDQLINFIKNYGNDLVKKK